MPGTHAGLSKACRQASSSSACSVGAGSRFGLQSGTCGGPPLARSVPCAFRAHLHQFQAVYTLGEGGAQFKPFGSVHNGGAALSMLFCLS